jgi:predicted HTH domain antitoxin
MDETVSVRIPSDLLRDLERLSGMAHQSRSDLLREVLHEGLERKRIGVAISAYRAGKASLGRARELADVPLLQLLEEFRRAGVLLNYSRDDLRADLEWAKER